MNVSRIAGQRVSSGRVLLAFTVVLSAAVVVLALGTRLSAPVHQAGSRAAIVTTPLAFEPNQGQTDARVKFLARGAGYGLFLTADEAVLKLEHLSGRQAHTDAVQMALVGANANPQVARSEQLPGKSNYIIGNDPSQWHSNIPHYARVAYQQVYPGIDLVYYGKQGQLEYDFRIAPGANPSDIRLSFAGQRNLEVNRDGDLVVTTAGGDLRFHVPVAYQNTNGQQQRVDSRFVVEASNRVSFSLGEYDRTRELVIDPVLTYSSYLGGSGDEACGVITGGGPIPGCPAIAVDSALNYYIAGSTTSASLPTLTTSTTAPAFQTNLASGAHANVYVAKFDVNNTLQEATYIGGNGTDTPTGVAADGAGNVYIGGTTTSTNFPTHNGFNAGPTAGGTHVFVTVLAPDFTALSYSTYLAGSGTDHATGLATDGKGNAFVIGTTSSTDFPTTANALQATSLSASDSQFFMAKINTLGTGTASLLYSTYFGGGNPASGAIVQGGGIAVDSSGNAYITGSTNFLHVGNTATDFPILNAAQDCLDTPAVVPPPSPAPACNPAVTTPDGFVAKLNPNTSNAASLLYSTYLGGSGTDSGTGIAVDSGLNVYVTGQTDSSIWYQPNPTTTFQASFGGLTDAFLLKLNNPAANSPVTPTYFTYLGGSGADVGSAVAVDTSGNARVTGWTSGGFPSKNAGSLPAGSGEDAFYARIDTSGTATAQAGDVAAPFGGAGVDHGTGIAVDGNFLTYLVGDTSGSFPLAGSPYQGGFGGATDAFISKIGSVGSVIIDPTNSTPSPTTVGVGNPVTFRYSIKNNGADPATGVIFTDNLPASGATFGSISSSPGTCGSPSGTTVVCSIGTLTTAATATVTVTMTPTTASPVFSNSGTVTSAGSSTASSKSETINVTDFSMSVSPSTPQTVAAGNTATYQVTVTPIPTYPNNVSLSCASGLPTQASCAFSTSTLTMTNTSSASSTLTISTTARPVSTTSLHHTRGLWYALLLPVSGFTLLGAGSSSRRRKWLLGMCVVALLGLVVFQSACGSSSSTPTVTGGTPAGTYTITINATSGSATRSQAVTLTVQ